MSPAPTAPHAHPRRGGRLRDAALGLAALLSGLLWASGALLLGPFWTACLALVPLAWTVDRFEPSLARAALAGLLAGTVAQASGLSFIVETFQRFFGLSHAAALLWSLLFFAVQGGQLALFAAWLARARQRGWPVVWSLVPAWLAAELLWPAPLPTQLGLALAEQPWGMQLAELGGVPLVSALLALTNASACALLPRRGGPTWRGSLAAALIVLVAWSATLAHAFHSVQRIERRMADAPQLEVGIVQANVTPRERRRDPEGNLERHLHLSRRAALRGPAPDLLVWPETALPRVDDARRVQLRVGVPLLFGGVERQGEAAYNTAFFVAGSDAPVYRYRKRRLLPLAEYLPLAGALSASPRFPNTTRFAPGRSMSPMRLAGSAVSVLICYEDVLAGLVREVVAHARPRLLVDLSNDGWFGATQEPRQHMAAARFRAVEHRLYLVRASQTGISGVIDPLGRVVVQSEVGEAIALRARVGTLPPHPTLYGQLGAWPAWTGLLVALVLALRRRRGAR